MPDRISSADQEAKRRILHLRDTYEIGGPGKTIIETFKHIDKKRFEVQVAVFGVHGKTEDTPFTREAVRNGIQVHRIFSRNHYDPGVIFAIARLVREQRFDLLHTHEVRSDVLGYAASRICRVPVVTTLHGWIGDGFKQKAMRRLDERIVRRFDGVIAVSEGMRDALVGSGVRPRIVRVLHNSIVVENYKDDGTRGYLSEAIGVDFKGPVIGTVGRLSPEKGHRDFVLAASIVLKRGCEATFVLVGDGPEKDRLARMIRDLGLASRIYIAGYLQDARRVFQDLDLMVLPSYTEGLPNVVLEALMMGVPIIATPVGGVPEIIEDGKTGLFVPPGNPEMLAAGMAEYLDDPCRFAKMAAQGSKVVEAKFDFRNRTIKLEALYDKVLRTGRIA